MKTKLILLCSLMPALLAAVEPPNPQIDYTGFQKLAVALEPVREQNRISEMDFIRMSKEPNTVILDARTKDKFEQIHIKGALHLALTDFTEDTLKALIPDKATRILIYCNNNFENDPLNFTRKVAIVSLNSQTFINLHAYGYTRVMELAPLLDVETTRIPFESPAAPKSR